MDEDYTLKARWVMLKLCQCVVAGLKQANLKFTGVRLGRVGWRCVDPTLTATQIEEGVSVTPAQKEIHKTAVFLG